MKKTITITRKITHEEQGEYIKIPFELPENVEKITVEYHYVKTQSTSDAFGEKPSEINTIDLGLYSTNGYLGESGSNRSSISVSNHQSAPGFLSDDMRAGTWYIMAGAYKVQPEGVSVEYTITLTFKEFKLFWGETHAHTTASDGKRSFTELVNEAAHLKLDYLFVTDHNTFSQNFLITSQEEINVLPGCEWTHYKGHANFLGIRKPIRDPYAAQTQEEMKHIFEEAKSNGAITIVNHAFDRNVGWDFDLEDTPFDLFEVWNGAVLPDDNHLAYEWWTKQLEKGKKILITGGADYHKTVAFRHVGQPAVGIWANSNTKEEILSNLRKGHVSIAYDNKAPSLLLETTHGIQGDTVPRDSTVTVHVENIKQDDELRIITNNDVKVIKFSEAYSVCSKKIVNNTANFMRLEVYRQPFSEMLKMPIAMTNALFFE